MSRTGATPLLRRAMLAGVGVMLLTSIHHAIGAAVYQTPWRLHVLFATIPVTVALLAAFAVHRRRQGRLAGRIAAGVVIALVTIFSVALFGLFEGVYNHVLKDALYGLGAGRDLMRALFPAPRYVMPDDLLFEVTGVLQAWPAVVAARALVELARLARRGDRSEPPPPSAPIAAYVPAGRLERSHAETETMTRTRRYAGAALLALTLLACGSGGPRPVTSRGEGSTGSPADGEIVAITGGAVIAAPGRAPVPDAVVVVRGGRIAAVGRRGEVSVPEGARVIDATGGTVLAGFWNCHVHLTEPVWQSKASVRDLDDALARTFSRWGFVHVVDTGSDPGVTTAIRRRVAAGELTGPTVRTAGVPLAGVDGTPIYVAEAGHRLPEPTSPEMARQAVADAAATGVDAIKIFAAAFKGRGRPQPVMKPAIVAAIVEEAHRRRLPVLAHPTNTDGLKVAVDGGVDVLLHTSPDGGAWPAGTAERLVARGVGLVPTLKLWRHELERAGAPAHVTERFQQTARDQLRAFAAAGGQVLFGTDVGYMPDPDTSDELRQMAQSGLDFAAILTSLTTAPATRFGAAQTGRVEPGLDADLVIVDGDPAADPVALSRVRMTMRAGRTTWLAR